MRRLVAIVVLVALPAGDAGRAGLAQVPCAEAPAIITELGARAQVIERLSAAPGVVTPYPSQPQDGARYVRVQVELSAPPDCDWFLSVRDARYRLIQTFGRDNVTGPAVRWTYRIPGDRALFDLQPCPGGGGPVVVFKGYIWMPDAAKNPYYSLQTAGQPAYRPLTDVDTSFRRLGDFTGLLMGSSTTQSWSCTGVMITPDLFLTNWHCGGPVKVRSALAGGGPADFPIQLYWSPAIWDDMVIDLSWDGDLLSRELLVTGVPAKDEALDFAILRVAAIDRLGPIRPVRVATARVAQNDPLRIVHHPGGSVKQLSWNCRVSDAQRAGWRNAAVLSEFTHLCDTEAGSSGAPVLDGRNELVGLHHLGFDYDTQACRYLDRKNKAVTIAAILEYVRDNHSALYGEVQRWQ
jgi:hypothetical protein